MKRESILLKIPKDLLEKVESYQKENSITTRSGAIYELIRKGLNSK